MKFPTLTSVSLITGLSVGAEYVSAIPEEHIEDSIILDVGIFRFIFTIS